VLIFNLLDGFLPDVLNFIMKFFNFLPNSIGNLPYFFYKSDKIAMFHTGRCGSTVLTNMIDQNPMVFWDGEVYEKFRKSILIKRFLTVNIINIIKLRSLLAKKFYGFEI